MPKIYVFILFFIYGKIIKLPSSGSSKVSLLMWRLILKQNRWWKNIDGVS